MTTRQERRRAERAAKKEKQGEQFQMHFEMWQPWSTFIMKTTLPPPILEKND